MVKLYVTNTEDNTVVLYQCSPAMTMSALFQDILTYSVPRANRRNLLGLQLVYKGAQVRVVPEQTIDTVFREDTAYASLVVARDTSDTQMPRSQLPPILVYA